ncbi:MAG: hypothetical protein RL272_539 [Candidatus Parcubacteria bacterium]|jgi:vacuolar-type H+-ATPase subunit I/STV1
MQVTLNLLSPEKKAVLRTGFIFAFAQTLIFIVFLVVVFASGTLLAVRTMLAGTYDDLAKRSGGTDESSTITTDVKKMNDYLKRIDALEQRYVPWSKVLEQLTSLIPAGTQLTSLHVEKTGKVAISGIARDRDDVLLLQSRLEDSPLFKDVKAPLSNILQQKDVRFDFEVQYVPPKETQ